MRGYFICYTYFTIVKFFLNDNKKEMGSVRPGQEALWQSQWLEFESHPTDMCQG